VKKIKGSGAMTVKHEKTGTFGLDVTESGFEIDVTALEPVSGTRQIQSVSRALDIIEVLATERNGISLSEISKRIELNSSTCHHLIATLVARGYVEHLGRRRGYALGSKVHDLVDLADGLLDPDLLLNNEMRDLGLSLGHSVQLAVLAKTSLLTKLRFDSPNMEEVLVEPDEIIKMTALHATATGKAILAWLPEIELVNVISANGLTKYTDKTITTLSELVAELRLVRRRGYSIDDEELQDGIICIGAALRDVGGAVVGAISTTVAIDEMTSFYRSEVAKTITIAAVEFSKRLRAAKK
jgi:IclR family acetate operon transcriptional repressor